MSISILAIESSCDETSAAICVMEKFYQTLLLGKKYMSNMAE
jgi:tRNA A37 threonylcarbamoyltransferase TsaD